MAGLAPRYQGRRGGGIEDPVEVEAAFGHVGEAGEVGREVGVFGGLDEAEVAFREGEGGIAWDGAQGGKADAGESGLDAGAVAGAGDAVEDDSADAHAGAVGVHAVSDGGRGLRLAGDVEHEKDREGEAFGEVCAGAGAAVRARDTVEEAHGAFDEEKAGALGQVVDEGGGHGPGVEVGAGLAGGGGVEGWIDVVGTGFGGAEGDAAAAEGGDEGEGDGGLAGAGAGGGDEPAEWEAHAQGADRYSRRALWNASGAWICGAWP